MLERICKNVSFESGMKEWRSNNGENENGEMASGNEVNMEADQDAIVEIIQKV